MAHLLLCPICGSRMEEVGTSPYRVSFERWIETPILECCSCDIFLRALDNADRVGHFYSAGYVQPERDSVMWSQRHQFLAIVLKLIEDYVGNSHHSLLDVGCGYGHLLELARSNGFDAEGIEINGNLVNLCRGKGLTVWLSMDEAARLVHAITMIDSLCYLARPVESMR